MWVLSFTALMRFTRYFTTREEALLYAEKMLNGTPFDLFEVKK